MIIGIEVEDSTIFGVTLWISRRLLIPYYKQQCNLLLLLTSIVCSGSQLLATGRSLQVGFLVTSDLHYFAKIFKIVTDL